MFLVSGQRVKSGQTLLVQSPTTVARARCSDSCRASANGRYQGHASAAQVTAQGDLERFSAEPGGLQDQCGASQKALGGSMLVASGRSMMQLPLQRGRRLILQPPNSAIKISELDQDSRCASHGGNRQVWSNSKLLGWNCEKCQRLTQQPVVGGAHV